MNFYIDIRLLSVPEIPDCILMNQLVSCLHNRLVVSGEGDIGISFPEVHKTLGRILRLHGKEDSLFELMATPWTSGVKDYFTISSIACIPENVRYRVVKRVQVKSNRERLIRRSVKKGWLTEEEAHLRYGQMEEKSLSLPYLRLKSQSTGQSFLLFVDHGPLLQASIIGKFTSYGLSSHATIPWF